MKEAYLTVQTVAKRLNCSISTVYALLAAGDLALVRTGLKKGYRVPESSLNQFLQKRISEFYESE